MEQPLTTTEEEFELGERPLEKEPTVEPPFGTREWIQYWSEFEGHLPTPINVSITGSLVYKCPDLKWYNFDIYPHKVKLTNTGYTLVVTSKWRTERPYLIGGPFLEKHVLSQIHFHWGKDMMEGSDHTVDERRYPGEMQVTFFRSEYLTQEEAMKYPDGVTMVCYLIKYGVNPDERLAWVIEGFPRIQEAQTNTRIGPLPMSRLMPMFYEDYFLYWGKLETVAGDQYTIKWLVPRVVLFASFEQMKEFRKLWDPWDLPNLGNFRPLQKREDRHIFYINPHWCRYNSLLPIPRVPELSISMLSPAYLRNPWMLPLQNRTDEDTAPQETQTINAEQISRLLPSQSPIAISLSQCPQSSSLDTLQYKGYWDNKVNCILLNNGKTAHFTFESEVRPVVRGGPLVGEYLFKQMHFHWSMDDVSGCEHILDGRGYASECHLVHYNSTYESTEEAMGHSDGLAVVGFLLEAVDAPNPRFDRLVEGFKRIKKCEQSFRVTSESLSWMDSNDLYEGNYVTYKGSLTTPPYTECVTWIIYVKPVHIGTKQLGILRKLESPSSIPIGRNVRPSQPQPPGHLVIYVKQVKSQL